MKVLFTTPILEHPAAGGPQLRIENSIKALAKVCQLDVISRAGGAPEAASKTDGYFRELSEEYHVVPRLVSSRARNRYLSLPGKILTRLFNRSAKGDADFIVNHIDRRKIDVVWFGYGNISYPLIRLIKKRRPNVRLVCDTDSVWSRFVLRELPYATGVRKVRVLITGRTKEAEERAWVNLCDVTTAVSEIDAHYYRTIAKDKIRVHLFSNVIDTASYEERPAAPIGFKKPSIYLAGSFGFPNSPMDNAGRWMLEEVFPIVLKSYPDVHFYIVGRNSEINFGHLSGPNITVTGRLESVLPYLCNTDIALVPLKYESGTRFKILEAGACNVPLVSTTLGAEGIPVVHGEHILIADKPQEFADAIITLLRDKDLANKLAQNCRKLVVDKFSVDSLADEAKRILDYLAHV